MMPRPTIARPSSARAGAGTPGSHHAPSATISSVPPMKPPTAPSIVFFRADHGSEQPAAEQPARVSMRRVACDNRKHDEDRGLATVGPADGREPAKRKPEVERREHGGGRGGDPAAIRSACSNGGARGDHDGGHEHRLERLAGPRRAHRHGKRQCRAGQPRNRGAEPSHSVASSKNARTATSAASATRPFRAAQAN